MAETNFVSEKDKFVEYKYKITEFYIIIDGKPKEFPTERITDFKIEHYFEEAVFPLFKLNLTMEASRYYEIVKNKDNIKFKIRIQKFYLSKGTQDQSLDRDFINDTFSIFMDDDNSDLQKDLKKEAGTYDDENELEKLRNSVELFLFKDSFVTGLRSSINAVLKDCNMCTAVTYLLYKAGIKHVLMSPFDNTKVYKSLVLPPQTIERQILYLNNNYGFHKKGSIVYFDLNHGYILDYRSGCTAWAKNEWKETSIYVLSKTNPNSHLCGSILKSNEKRHCYSVDSEAVDISAPSVVSNVLNQGADVTTIDMLNSTTEKKSSKAKTKGNANSKVLFNNTSNPYMGETYTAQQHANGAIISIGIQHADIEAFTPNKCISVIFEDGELNKAYKGKYRVTTAIYTFESGGNTYNLTASVQLKKVT